jgi:glutaredoxin
MNKIMNFFKNKEKDDVIMFTSLNCNYCAKTKEALDKANIKYIEKDIKEYPAEWHEVVSVTGMPVTPALFYMGDYLMPARDYPNPEILIKILNDFQGTNNTQITLERLKTLNHHINQAFNTLDMRLKNIEEKLSQTCNVKESKNGKSKNTKKAKK